MRRLPSLRCLLPGLCIALVTAQSLAAVPGEFEDTGSLIIGRAGLQATLLLNGKVLVVGGDNVAGDGNTAELYDPATGTWSNTGNLNTARFATSTLLPNGKVLVVGGVASTELYDPNTGTWS